ncbi:MAG TPA: C-terminal binding protein [Candidatus Dormibacteraeota bacterium]|nr:C-terminal binding protein [Candidatus Dormibacteraeota bacterium]
MAQRLVAVSDSVFPNLDLARDVVSRVGAELRLASEPTPEKILEVAREADGLLATYAKITADMIKQMKRCRIISRFGIGVDNVDVAAATAAGIVVTKVPDYCIDEVSDHAMALLLSLVRKIPASSTRAHAGRWEMPAVVPIHRLRGTTLGLAGFGRIPQLVAPKAKAFGLRVITFDPYVPQSVLDQAGVERVDFDQLISQSDYISIHTPLMPETHHLFNAEVFRKMKPGSLIVNTSRGPVVDEAALAAALDAGQLAGAALDVLEQEPPTSSPLFGRDNVILTPHTSFYSVEALEDLQTKAAEEVVRVLSGEPPRNPVNPEALKTARN